MAFSFIQQDNNTPANSPDGSQYYPMQWDNVRKAIISDNPAIPGYDTRGNLKAPKGLYDTGQGSSVSPAGTSGLPSIFAGLTNPTVPANQTYVTPPSASTVRTPVSDGVGSTPVYPLNVPTTPGVSGIAVPKSQIVNDQTNAMFGDLNTLKTNVSGVLDQFNKQFPDFLANQQKTNATENAATGGIYDGTEQAQQNALLADYTNRANAANAKSIADTQRLHSRTLLASGAGDSSAADRGQFSTIANINAQAAANAADRALSSNQWLTNLQQTMAGAAAQRNRLAMGDVTLPNQVNQQAFSSILGNLQGLSATDLANLISGVTAPGGYVGDTIGGLQSAKLGDLNRLNTIAQMQQNQNQFNANFGNTTTQSNAALLNAVGTQKGLTANGQLSLYDTLHG